MSDQDQNPAARVYMGTPTDIGAQHIIDSMTPLLEAAAEGGASVEHVAAMLSGCVAGAASVIVAALGPDATTEILRETANNVEARRTELATINPPQVTTH